MTPEQLQSLTNKQLLRLAKKTFRECDKMAREHGGCEYGWDWPTFAVNFPEKYEEMQAIRLEGRRRKFPPVPV